MYENEYSIINFENSKLNNIAKEGDSDFDTIPSEEEDSSKNEVIDLEKLRNKFQNDISKIQFNAVNCCENYAGNYDNYVFNTLRGIAEIRKVNFNFCKIDPYYQKNIENFDFSCFDKNKKILILDLDETLIHADFNERFPKNSYDKIIKFIPKDEDEEIKVGIFIRNGINEFFTQLSKYFNIIIFTASSSDYADAVLDCIDPEKKFIKLRLYRENCVNINDLTTVKDLTIIRNIDLSKTIIIDNSMYSFSNQLSNGILINSFYNDKNDNDLINVKNYLLNYIIDCKDVRKINENVFKFESILKQIEKEKQRS